MGRKDAARAIAVAAGVPVVPAVEDDADDELAARAAAEVGFPVLVKAAAGGGGKGMRIVRAPRTSCAEAVAAARREARAAFGDDTHARRAVRRARPPHRGAGARRRPRQRRAPLRARLLDPAPPPEGARGGARADDLRRACATTLTGAAVAPRRARSATSTPAPSSSCSSGDGGLLPGDEHPAAGRAPGHRAGRPALDLVELQLRVAAGEPLPFAQDDVARDGHAIEARVYAEDPSAGFLPQAGTADARALADRGRGSTPRSRAARRSAPAYDPMLGKVIAHGATARPPAARWSPRSTTPRSSG